MHIPRHTRIMMPTTVTRGPVRRHYRARVRARALSRVGLCAGTVALLLSAKPTKAQDLYFPPLVGDTWETMDPSELNWCPDSIDALYDFLDNRNSKAFLLLKDGRIVLEHYTGTFTQDSLWYWASAGKTLTSTLVGIAQEEGYLDIADPTSDHLGTGWTVAPPDKEGLITVRNQLTMTSGLDDGVFNSDCTDPACLQYLADAGTRWAYHNAPYTILDQVIANATGQSFPSYFNAKIRTPIGMNGLWLTLDGYNNVYFSHARSMARYGLLALNHMVWDTDTILHDQDYFTAATTPSQDLNDSYGYLWWLNGQSSFMLPGLQIVWPGSLMPHAPADMFSALGKNDQLLNVVPSRNMVLVRMGNPAYEGLSVAITFNDEIWERIEQLDCSSVGISATDPANTPLLLSPNPCADRLSISQPAAASWTLTILDLTGRVLMTSKNSASVDVSALVPGVYMAHLSAEDRSVTATFRKD
jgi:CubicO group peptidase (beta-lactamase class C family)